MSACPSSGRDISRPEFIALIAAFMTLNALAIDVMLPARHRQLNCVKAVLRCFQQFPSGSKLLRMREPLWT